MKINSKSVIKNSRERRMPKKERKIAMSATVDPDIYNEFNDIAESLPGINRSNIIEELIQKFVDSHNQKK